MSETENADSILGMDEWDSVDSPIIAAKGFREYDGRWLFPQDINLSGAIILGQSLGQLMHEEACAPEIIVGHDYRHYAQSVTQALILGLINRGINVVDIGTVISPVAYFSRVHLNIAAVAMVTASHNPNGWTGLKAGLRHPLTLNPAQMRRLRDIALSMHPGDKVRKVSVGHYRPVKNIAQAYTDDLCRGHSFKRPIKVVCATGNGTAGKFAPEILRRLGCDVIPLHTEPDWQFPHYNPNPESIEMLQDMERAVKESGAAIGYGFDGDGDRLGVVDNLGRMVSSDKIGLLMALSLVTRVRRAKFIVDIKSTGLFATHPALKEYGSQVEYWKTGHSHMKLRLLETAATAAFEKSGHFYFGDPIGRGYDDALVAALELCRVLDAMPQSTLSDLVDALPKSWVTPTMSPYCDDEEKYDVVANLSLRLQTLAKAGGTLGGQKIIDVLTTNGARCVLANGSWGLVRASSNTPNLVVVCESMASEVEMRAIFNDLDGLIRQEKAVGEYDQRI